jgi:hypothetical protein
MRARSRRTARIGAALAVASGALVACNLITGLDKDYSSTAHDGAVSTIADGGVEGSPNDGASPEGSSNDGMVANDGANVTFCQAAQGDTAAGDFLCTDFENDAVGVIGLNAPLGFDMVVDNVGGTISVVADAGVSGSHALDVLSDTPDAKVYRQLRVVKHFANSAPPAQYQSYEIDIHFRLVGAVVDYNALALLVFEGATNQENGVAGYKFGADQELSHEGPLDGSPAMVNDFQWHTAKLVLEHTDASAGFERSLSFDGTRVIEAKTPNHVFDPTAVTTFSIGSFNTAMSGGRSEVQFDNVVVRRKPF